MKLLESNRIILRAVEPSDLDEIFKWENDTNIWQYGSTIAPYSKRQICEYIKNYSADIYKDMQLRLMITDNATSKTIGMIDLYDFNPFHSKAHIGILIAPEHARQGYGYEAVETLMKYASDFLGLHQLAVCIPSENTASINLFTKLGFRKAGVLNDWLRTGESYRDAVMMQKIISGR